MIWNDPNNVDDIDDTINVLQIYNYPNPFNSATSIHVDIPRAEHVRIEIYNMNGQLVARVADRLLPVGTHQFTWNAGERESGLYHCRVVTSDRIMNQKMLLVK